MNIGEEVEFAGTVIIGRCENNKKCPIFLLRWYFVLHDIYGKEKKDFWILRLFDPTTNSLKIIKESP